MYIVYDSLGNPLRRFPTRKAASTYKIAMQRYDWPVIEIKNKSRNYE